MNALFVEIGSCEVEITQRLDPAFKVRVILWRLQPMLDPMRLEGGLILKNHAG
jgi:hypothetical protein